MRAAKELALEGVIAKRKDSLYESGKRSGAWVKYRINQAQEFVVGGYVPDHPFDSIIVGYYREDKLYYAGKVRNGFVPHTRYQTQWVWANTYFGYIFASPRIPITIR